MEPDSQRDGRLEHLREAVCAAVQDCPEVAFVALFGSAARGEPRPGCDVDLAVRVSPGNVDRLALRLTLLARLEPAVHPRRLDLILTGDAPPLLCERIASDGVPLYLRARAEWTGFQARAWLASFDERPLRERFTRAMQRRLQEGSYGRP